ncbi:beta-N-acetylhexosaminidase [Aliishimia ponticola]|uniref:beta-N-acetylhexosaminidase n=1 Tax=Aliishimia ponticola TaxID=2499833 RepID=A0A4V3XKY5_9RHOB|nr:beta-N-acetylhexosaminidase [Aliishimia ponticola]THH38783.1 beta-N-acetylhexosaminidase [Aliishimia ponticola]
MSRYGACILSTDGPTLNEDERALFREVNPFGFILFARHIETPEQVHTLCDSLREAVGRNCLITIDQEGGRVQRLRAPQWREWSAPLDFINAASDPVRAMYLRARIMADELLSIGLDSNCIPTLDVARPDTHPFLHNRCYGTSAEQVIANGLATADGLRDGGVMPVIKHIPGHGRAQQDSHFDLPVVSASLDALRDSDFQPFQALAGEAMAMTAHLVYSAISDLPATLCPKTIDMIRTEIGFDGLLMTDDISMKALSGSLADLSRQSLDAGCDVVLHCNDTFAQRREVAEAAGQMSDAAQARAEAAEAARKPEGAIDIPAMEAELEALLGGALNV